MVTKLFYYFSSAEANEASFWVKWFSSKVTVLLVPNSLVVWPDSIPCWHSAEGNKNRLWNIPTWFGQHRPPKPYTVCVCVLACTKLLKHFYTEWGLPPPQYFQNCVRQECLTTIREKINNYNQGMFCIFANT